MKSREESIHRAHKTKRDNVLSLMMMIKIRLISITLISTKMSLRLRNLELMMKERQRIHQARTKKVHNKLKPNGLKKKMRSLSITIGTLKALGQEVASSYWLLLFLV